MAKASELLYCDCDDGTRWRASYYGRVGACSKKQISLSLDSTGNRAAESSEPSSGEASCDGQVRERVTVNLLTCSPPGHLWQTRTSRALPLLR